MTLRHEDVEGLYANARAEVVRLRFINADLLAALEVAKEHCLALNHPVFPALKLTERCPFCATAADAIAKTKGD